MAANLSQIDEQVLATGTKPLLRALTFRTQATNGQPEFFGMIWYRQMHSFMSDQILEDELRRQNETPIK